MAINQNNSFLEIMVELEKDLAKFYHLMRLGDLRLSHKYLKLIINQSEEHAHKVESLAEQMVKPDIPLKRIYQIYEHLKDNLPQQIRNTPSEKEKLTILANNEEMIGKIYLVFANHCEKLSNYYKQLSQEIKFIAEEEFVHRDILLKEAETLPDGK